MTDDNTNDAQGHGQAREPNPALRALDGLVGTRELPGTWEER